MARPAKTGTLRPLISRTVSAAEIPKGAKLVRPRGDGMYPQLLRRIHALRRDQVEQVEFDSERQATVACYKLRSYAKRANMAVEIWRDGAVCCFKKGLIYMTPLEELSEAKS